MDNSIEKTNKNNSQKKKYLLIMALLLRGVSADLAETLIPRHFQHVSRHFHGLTNLLTDGAGRYWPWFTARFAQDPYFPQRIPAVRVFFHEGNVKVSVDEINVLLKVIEEEFFPRHDARIESVPANDDDVSLTWEALILVGVAFRQIIDLHVEFLFDKNHLPKPFH